MATTAVHTFDAPIEAVWEMFTNRDAHVAKFVGMGHRDVEVLDCAHAASTFRIKVKRVVDVELPGFARRVLTPTNTVISTDEWRDGGDGTYSGRWTVEAPGV